MEIHRRETLRCNNVVFPDVAFGFTGDSSIEASVIIVAGTIYVFYEKAFLDFCLHFYFVTLVLELLETIGQLCKPLFG